MATTYNTAFGSLPGYNEMLGTTNTTGGGQQQTYGQTMQTTTTPPFQAGQTFAQMQRMGMARPAPPQAPQAQPFAQYGGSQQAQQMRQRLQEQLQQFGQAPSRFDTQAFQQIRGAQAANLQQEYRGQLQALNEELARRGLSASSIGGGRMGDLAGQQARALASLDAELLQRAAETQAQDRAQLLAASQGLAELASAQDLAQFEANRVAQAATFENQLRAAQFGQQQFEQAGQEAFQGAQAEQAARQAAQQFGLQATGQAATLSMDLQRLLGQQELERAQLTGQLGGAQTLAAQQQAEQRRQFDIQQMLQAQLGLGGLSLEQQRFAEQARQFGVTSAEEQRQFNVQQALQAQLGLGGLGIQQQEVNIRAQQLQQEAALQGRQLSITEAQNLAQNQLEAQRLAQQQQQFGAQLGETQAARLQQYGVTQQELGLRAQQLQQEAQLQGRQLSITEAQNQAGNQIERERMAQQGQQFGLQLGETQAARLQQYGLSVQELGLRSQQLQQEAQLQGRQLSITEAQNLAQNQLEQQRVTNQAAQFGLQLNEQQAQRLQQGGFTAQELALEAQRVGNQAAQFGQQLSAQERQNAALNNLEQQKITDDRAFRAQQLGLNGRELDIRASQIQQEFQQRGQQITNDQAYRQAELALRTTQIQNENAIAGRQIDVDEARIQAQRDLSAADNTAQMARLTSQLTSQEKIATMESQLRQQLGLTEATGQVYTVGPDGKLVAGGETLESQLRRAQLTGTLGGQATLERLQQNLQQAQILSQITGRQYTVDATGNLVAGGTATEQARQFDLENKLRQALGMSEATGYVYDPITGARTSAETVQGQIARSQVLLSLANSLGNLTPEQIAQLLGKASPTSPPGGGGTPTTPPNTNDDGRLGAGQTELLQTITAPSDPKEGWLYNIGGTLVRYKNGKYYKMDGSIFTPGSTPTTPPNTPTTPPNTPTTPPNTPTTPPNTPTTPPSNPTTTTTQDPTSTTPLTDNERQLVTSSLSGALFDGRYKYEPSLGSWVVYKGNNWYRYGATPPTQNITWNGQNLNVYPGYSTYYNGEILTWDGRTWITSSTTLA